MLTNLRTTWQAAGWIRCLIGLPLCVALWNAPLPWVHRHEITDVPANAELAWHLRKFHHSKPQGSSSGWHWHIALLWQMAECDERSADDPPPLPILLAEENTPCINSPDISPRELLETRSEQGFQMLAPPRQNREGDSARRASAAHPGRYLQTFLPHAALRDLLGVALC